MEKIVIKKMESEDEINGKGYVHYKSWHETYAGLIDADYLERHTLEKCIATAHKWSDNILVAKDGERVVGFVQYGSYNYGDLEDAGEIIALYVLADHYGKGIGYRLMQEALQHLNDYSQIALFVIKDNQRAIDFYTHYGFHFDGQEGMSQVGVTVARMILKRQL